VRTYKEEGIILSRRNLGEADRILTILTKYHGKISAIAKGVRRIKSKKAPYLDQLSCASLVLAKGKDLDLVVEASSIEAFPEIKKNLYASATALYGAELVNSLTVERVEGKNVFLLFLEFLREIAKLSDFKKLISLLLAFEVKLLFALGFWSQREFRIGVREKEILDFSLRKNLSETKELEIEHPERLEAILRKEIEEIAEKKLKSAKIFINFW
jgi:DNA repair protein RecO